jgi:threonine dehydrogenase-like Zn-dependent dehydrogenase
MQTADLQKKIVDTTNGKGPDAVIEAVGLESHGAGGIAETLKTKMLAPERPYALEQAIMACRPGGTVSLPGVFVGAVGPITARAGRQDLPPGDNARGRAAGAGGYRASDLVLWHRAG